MKNVPLANVRLFNSCITYIQLLTGYKSLLKTIGYLYFLYGCESNGYFFRLPHSLMSTQSHMHHYYVKHEPNTLLSGLLDTVVAC